DDIGLRSLKLDRDRYDLFFAPGVFCYIPPRRARELLDHSTRIADWIVVCDLVVPPRGTPGRWSGIFFHPYERLLAASGWHVTRHGEHIARGNDFGLVVARSAASGRAVVSAPEEVAELVEAPARLHDVPRQRQWVR